MTTHTDIGQGDPEIPISEYRIYRAAGIFWLDATGSTLYDSEGVFAVTGPGETHPEKLKKLLVKTAQDRRARYGRDREDISLDRLATFHYEDTGFPAEAILYSSELRNGLLGGMPKERRTPDFRVFQTRR